MKKFISRIKQAIISQNDYFNTSKDEISHRNMQLTSIFCVFSILLVVIVFTISVIYDYIFKTNFKMNPIFFLFFIPFMIFLIISKINPKKKFINQSNIMLYTTLIYIYSIIISIIFSVFVTPNMPSIYYPIFIVCVPIFFILPFGRKLIINTFSIIIYVILALNFKNCDLTHDIFEACIAYLFSIFVIFTMLQLKIQNAKINNKYRQRSIQDSLTKMLNRTGGIDEMIYYLQHVDENEEYALAFIDLDNFKNINDTYGHVDGDRCLQKIANILIDVAKDDILCRFGGDEFLLLIKNTSEKFVKEKLNNIQYKLKELSKLENKNLNCSIGVYIIQGKITSINNLLDEADKALYEAKKNGKNQFIIKKSF